MFFRSSAFRFEKTEQLSFRQERTNSRICKSQFQKLHEEEFPDVSRKQSGAVEACWAHNPEVRGSKPRFAIFYFSYLTLNSYKYCWLIYWKQKLTSAKKRLLFPLVRTC